MSAAGLPPPGGPAPYTVSMDPERARQLTEEGAALLVLNVPPGTYFGVDQLGFTLGPKFKGLKMVPPGPHFISYRAASMQGGASLSAATGFFIFVKPREVVTKVGLPHCHISSCILLLAYIVRVMSLHVSLCNCALAATFYSCVLPCHQASSPP